MCKRWFSNWALHVSLLLLQDLVKLILSELAHYLLREYGCSWLRNLSLVLRKLAFTAGRCDRSLFGAGVLFSSTQRLHRFKSVRWNFLSRIISLSPSSSWTSSFLCLLLRARSMTGRVARMRLWLLRNELFVAIHRRTHWKRFGCARARPGRTSRPLGWSLLF